MATTKVIYVQKKGSRTHTDKHTNAYQSIYVLDSSDKLPISLTEYLLYNQFLSEQRLSALLRQYLFMW